MIKKIEDYYLLWRCIRGLKNLNLNNKIYQHRLIYEWKVISQKNFSIYFLVLRDIIIWAKKMKILVGDGRGSSGGSLICYLLGITNVDPIYFGLSFDRFINISREDPPDVDCDFDASKRDEVINYIKAKYGKDNAIQLGTHGIMKFKMTLKNICKVFDYDFQTINDITKQMAVEDVSSKDRESLDDRVFNIDDYPTLKAFAKKDPKNQKIIDYALRLTGHIHHLSIHPAGILIINDNDKSYLPIRKYKGQIITSWTEGIYRKELTKLGFLKYDLLGLNNLTTIQEILNIIHKDNKYYYKDIPLNDEKTYKLFRKADTLGIFQFESDTARGLLKKIKPEKFEHLVAVNSLNRPGPLMSGIDKDYARRKNNNIGDDKTYTYNILKETYGVMIYQEQYLEIAKKIAGFNATECNELRYVFGKYSKKKSGSENEVKEILQIKEKFINGSIKVLNDKNKASELWNMIEKFAYYSFNKAHSCAYALLAYKSMYFKAHYPVQFYLANIRNSNIDKLGLFYSLCKSKGIKILPIDINKSNITFDMYGNDIIYGFSNIKYITEKGAIEIVKNRPFKTFDIFLDRLKSKEFRLNKRIIIALIKSGAFDNLISRKDAFEKYWIFRKFKEDNPYKQLKDIDILIQEREVYNFIISNDIFTKYIKNLNNMDVHSFDDFYSSKVKKGYIYSFIDSVKKIRTKTGNTMYFLNLFDGLKKASLTIWTKDYYDNKNLIDNFKSGNLIYASVIGNIWNDKFGFVLDPSNNRIKLIK